MLSWFKALDRVLKGDATRPGALRGGTIDLPLGGLVGVGVLLAALYGACMGASALVARWDTPTRHLGYLQIAYSAAKVPLLFFLTLVVTFPSLYVFNALVGSRLSFGTVLRLLVAALAVALAVLASFGTIVLFFALCTTSYPFMVLLNVALFALAGLLGMGFLLQTLHRLAVGMTPEPAGTPSPDPGGYPPALAAGGYATEAYPGAGPQPPMFAPDGTPLPPPVYPPPVPPTSPGALDPLQGQALGRHVKRVFLVWVIVFGLVGAQMGWVLRPFIGDPALPVTFFRAREGNFFEAVAGKVEGLFEGSSKRPQRRGPAWPSRDGSQGGGGRDTGPGGTAGGSGTPGGQPGVTGGQPGTTGGQ